MNTRYLLLPLAALMACQTGKVSPSADAESTAPIETPASASKSGTTFSLPYEKYTLANGLEVVLHEDHSDPIVAVATLMHVGSNREKPGKTGFAHFFEHMSFNDSENVPRGANRKLIPEWGGTRNGGTWSDGTIYYEVVPKDAFDKILWVDSDRFGYMINTVTTEALEREKQVVKNEKRQRNDNAPYGHTDEVIRKHLYPEGHPYSWTVIGSLPDLQAATLDDVKEFYEEYYGAANATLVIAGDIDIAETKRLVEKWFGEIRRGPEVAPLAPMPVTLTETKSLYYEDNFAKLPELRRVYPSVEEYNPDAYALSILGQLLSGSKKAPLYQVIVEENKLAPEVSSYQSSNELAGEFVLRVRANAGTDLDQVQSAIDQAFQQFETKGISETDLKRIKAEMETQLYQGVATVLNKAFQLVQDNEFAGDPGFITQRAELMRAVTSEDVMRVYKKYISNKPYVMTSFVPKGSAELAVEGAELAEVYIEEVVAGKENEEVSAGEEAEYEKTPSKYDRSEPAFGEAPVFKMPDVWTAELSNGMGVYGIENNELPLVAFDITLEGGHYLDPLQEAGQASLLGDLMMEGTARKTPAELEEAIGMLGASIDISVGSESMTLRASCLERNFKETLALVQEILLEPRWDSTEFARLKQALETNLKGREANPTAIASLTFNKLMYGDNHILGLPVSGTLETTADISLEDLKAYYQKNISPSVADFHVAGAVNQQEVMSALQPLAKNWAVKEVPMPNYTLEATETAGNVYFIDVPGSKQSVLFLGQMAPAADAPDFDRLSFANEKLGGGSSGQLTQILRIEKGYTYGAYSFLSGRKEASPFIAYGSVRANATVPSLEIIEDLIGNYKANFGEEDVAMTQNKVLKENTKNYESLYAKLGILHEISEYGKPLSYITDSQNTLLGMDTEAFQQVIDKYLQEKDMTYVIVGDAETQLEGIKAWRSGKVTILDIYGNQVNQ